MDYAVPTVLNYDFESVSSESPVDVAVLHIRTEDGASVDDAQTVLECVVQKADCSALA